MRLHHEQKNIRSHFLLHTVRKLEEDNFYYQKEYVFKKMFLTATNHMRVQIFEFFIKN